MSLAFLSKKNFNPSNISNQKIVWEAQQRKIQNSKQIQEREEQLKREREDEDLARAIGGRRGGDEASLRFMYDAPPGLTKTEDDENDNDGDDKAEEVVSSSNVNCRELSITERHPGDDEAAAKFRFMLAAYYNNNDDNTKNSNLQTNRDDPQKESNETNNNNDLNEDPDNNVSTTVDTRTQLEKAVGKRNTNQALTLQEQIARFPQLKNAPMAKGMNVTNVHVKFNPVSGPLRNVRCLACGVWGHSKGDRECNLTWNPFAGGGASSSGGGGGGCVEIKEEATERKKRHDNDNNDDSSSSSGSYNRRHKRHKKKKKHRHESSSRHGKSHKKSKRSRRESSR